MIKIEVIGCYSCEAKAIVPADRAKWVCRECGKDNSLYVVLLYKAANPTKRKAKLSKAVEKVVEQYGETLRRLGDV